MSRMRGRALVMVLCAALVGGAACSTDGDANPSSPKLLQTNDIPGARVTVIADFSPARAPTPGCDFEGSLLPQAGGLEDVTFRAWRRTYDGYDEQVAVGFWKRDEDALQAGMGSISRNELIIDCNDRLTDRNLDDFCFYPHTDHGWKYGWEYECGFRIAHFEAKPKMISYARIYSWAAGYTVTAWVRRVGNMQVDYSEAVMLLELQMKLVNPSALE